jgi:hypothetical protein
MPIESSYFRERARHRCERARQREVRAIIIVPIVAHGSIEPLHGLSLAFCEWRKKSYPAQPPRDSLQFTVARSG